jgi:hypothetical protein
VKKRALSARALRDHQNYTDDCDDVSTVFVKPIDGLASRNTNANTSSGSTAVFTILMVIALVVGTVGLPESNRHSSASIAKPGSFSAFRSKLRSYAAVKVTDDFKRGLNSWTPVGAGMRDWSYRDGFVRPGRLRLLKDSVGMADYQIEFAGEIEHKALSWVYRARDSRNYYASKIVVTKPGPVPRIDLVRYAVIGGDQQLRTSIPLPVTVRADALYKVQMMVKARDFSTMVNGTMVDSWSDSRLPSGGVGFFAENGEVATLRYVTVSDKDTLIGRVLSYLGFLRPVMPLF